MILYINPFDGIVEKHKDSSIPIEILDGLKIIDTNKVDIIEKNNRKEIVSNYTKFNPSDISNKIGDINNLDEELEYGELKIIEDCNAVTVDSADIIDLNSDNIIGLDISDILDKHFYKLILYSEIYNTVEYSLFNNIDFYNSTAFFISKFSASLHPGEHISFYSISEYKDIKYKFCNIPLEKVRILIDGADYRDCSRIIKRGSKAVIDITNISNETIEIINPYILFCK